MSSYPSYNRMIWRASRRAYMRARGEQRFGTIDQNGERLLIEKVVAATAVAAPFTVLDVGANQGEYSTTLLTALPADRRDPSRTRIHAFEPVPATGAMFDTALAQVAGHQCVTRHEIALSDKPGEAQIAVYAEGAGTNTLHFAREGRSDRTLIKVPLVTLADFVAEQGIAHIHLAKIDTEGNDAAVIRGAMPLLQSEAIDLVQFEYNHRWVFGRAFLKDVFELIAGLPYALARVDETKLTVFEDWHPELERFFQSNYALVHTHALDWFDLHRGHFNRDNTYG